MKLENARISILVGEEGATIELHDRDSGTSFARVLMSAEQFMSALGRHVYCEVEKMEVFNLDRLGKKLEVSKHEFEYDGTGVEWEKKSEAAYEQGLKTLPEGWQMDKYFQSQDSFFSKDGKDYARGVIRRWTDKKESDEKD